MPVYRLSDELIFPSPELAEPDGLLAIGGDLSVERLVLAYSNGIFPWPVDEDYPVTWASPDPRMIFYPKEFKVSKSLRQIIRRKRFTVKFDTSFEDVIYNCAQIKRQHETGTWITQEVIDAYIELHMAGLAHTVEIFEGEKLVGGLYGLSLGKTFFGESMFHTVSNASKVAFYYLVERMVEWDFDMIDGQVENPFLTSLGGINVSRKEYLEKLKLSLRHETKIGKW